jgi:hypothetical protein
LVFSFLLFQAAFMAAVVPGNNRWRTQIGTSIHTTDQFQVDAGELEPLLRAFQALHYKNTTGEPAIKVSLSAILAELRRNYAGRLPYLRLRRGRSNSDLHHR